MIRHVPSLEVVQAQWSLLPLAEFSVWFLELLQGAGAVREGGAHSQPSGRDASGQVSQSPRGDVQLGLLLAAV